jgi:hypothetical protein
MNTAIQTQHVGYLIIIWFLTGTFFGYSQAKYTRKRKSGTIIFALLVACAIAITFWLFQHPGG